MKYVLLAVCAVALMMVSMASANVIVSYNGNSLGLFSDSGELIRNYATDLSNPQGVTVDNSGHVYVANYGTGQVRMYNIASGALVRDVVDKTTYRPTGLAFNPANPGEIIMMAAYDTGGGNFTASQLGRWDTVAANLCNVYTNDLGVGYASVYYFPCITARSWTAGIYVAAAGSVFQKFDPNTLTAMGGDIPAPGAGAITGTAKDIYWTGTSKDPNLNGYIQRGSDLGILVRGMNNPMGITNDGTNLWVAQNGNNAVGHYNVATGELISHFKVTNPVDIVYVFAEPVGGSIATGKENSSGQNVKAENADANRINILQNEFLLLEADSMSPRLTKLGWDTERTGRTGINLLKSPVELRLSKKGQIIKPQIRVGTPDDRTIKYDFVIADGRQLTWEIALHPEELRMLVSCNADISDYADKLELVFPFNPKTAVTSIISSTWTSEGKFQIPAIINAPDLGQMLVTCAEHPKLTGRIEGSRAGKWVTATFELLMPSQDSSLNLKFSPVMLPMPAGFKDEKRWKAARRGWFNLIQQSSGASGGGVNIVNGVWANNVISDPVSSLVYMLGDATLLVPELAPGVSMPPILRRTVDYWMDVKTYSDGLVSYTAGGEGQNVMDGNPSVLIGAWCYVKASGDTEWLKRRIERLEFLSQYMEKRDVDSDGLIESKQSGNSGSRLHQRDPDMCWDCYVAGYKNAYVNALAYRAWRSLADLEKSLGRHEQEQRYIKLAERLKASYLDTFYNSETGWLGLWRSQDGKLHDLYMDLPTSFSINYGLIDKDKGREMLQRYWQALKESGFKRFDLGVPLNLKPVPREEMEHYTEFQTFLNGGCTVITTSYLLNALYIVGMTQQADMILDAMLKRQWDGAFPNGGGFQNGFVDIAWEGGEVFDWNGKPTGYEGHLVYNWSFLHSMLLKEPLFRDRVYETIK